MRNDDDETRKARPWRYPDDARRAEPDDDAEAQAEDIQRRMCRDRMLGMWRAAVGAVADVAKAEHARNEEPPHAQKGWAVPAHATSLN